MTSFIGGATDIEIVQHSEEEIARIVQDENARILGITGPPIESAVWGYTRALPQYNLGHGHIVEAIRDANAKRRTYFSPGIIWKAPPSENASKTASTQRKQSPNILQGAAAVSTPAVRTS